MSTDRLRDALRDAADLPAPTFSPAAALAGARRRRHRATALTAGVAALATAALVLPAVALRSGAVEPAGGQGTYVAGYAFANPASESTWDHGDYRVYDRRARRYVPAPWRNVVPSPDGRLVAVSDYAKVGIVPADRIQDTTAVRWITTAGFEDGGPRPPAVWSPDGTRVILDATWSAGYVADEPGSRYRIDYTVLVVDARTLEPSVRRLSWDESWSPEGFGRVVFGPAGFAVAQDRTVARNGLGSVLVLLDEQGTAYRRIATGGRAVVADQPFSPDGTAVALTVGGSTLVRDVATGAEISRADGAALGWLDDDRYLVAAGGSVRIVERDTGRTQAEKPLAPAGGRVTAVWPATGSPRGAIVL